MTEERQIYANYDEEGIYVYQAFNRQIVDYALEHGTFGDGFKMERMTWIKPSFAWMLYRSGYATKPNQEAILKVKISHEGFLAILNESVVSSYRESSFEDQETWQQALKKSQVRHQWDPERTLKLEKHDTRRAIQLGLRASFVRKYVNEWIIQLQEVTELAHQIKQSIKMKQPYPTVPKEIIYEVNDTIKKRLRITS